MLNTFNTKVPTKFTCIVSIRYANTNITSASGQLGADRNSASIVDGAASGSAAATSNAAAAACYAVDEDTSSHLAKEELNLLAKLIGGNEADGGGGSKDTFKLNLFDICGGGPEKHGCVLSPCDFVIFY